LDYPEALSLASSCRTSDNIESRTATGTSRRLPILIDGISPRFTAAKADPREIPTSSAASGTLRARRFLACVFNIAASFQAARL